MKTTLVIDDQVMTRLKEEAARQGTTISALVEAALRAFLRRPRKRPELPSLPTFEGGPFRVDIADRAALDAALGED
ncbi:MAG TPA: ribbon-helix-helix protein, CopG family [Planctomycetota bacterium]